MMGLLLLLLLVGCFCRGAAAPFTFAFNVSDGGGATLTVGTAETSVFYMQSQFSEPPTTTVASAGSS